jgi:hypothetical protein
MKYIIVNSLIGLSLFFTGCSTKIGMLEKDKRYTTLMQYTKRGEIVKSLETVALINATYLNHILDKNETANSEVFIIGVYNSNDYSDYKKGGIFNPHYKLTMNDNNFTKVVKADKIKLNLSNYPFYNKWMKYYKVYFPKTDKSSLKIVYSNKTEGNVTLTIPKNIYIPKED